MMRTRCWCERGGLPEMPPVRPPEMPQLREQRLCPASFHYDRPHCVEAGSGLFLGVHVLLGLHSLRLNFSCS